MTPNKVNIQKWVDALRSGEYVQGRNSLLKDNTYCCLGVACEVYLRGNPGGISFEVDEDGRGHYDNYSGFLPPKVMEWLGVDDDSPEVTDQFANTSRRSAIYINDNLRWDFNQIADGLEGLYLK